MKNFKFNYLSGVLIVLFFSSCIFDDFIKYGVSRYSDDHYEPTKSVERLHTEPSKRYIKLASIGATWYEGSSRYCSLSMQDLAEIALEKKARELGADAIIYSLSHVSESRSYRRDAYVNCTLEVTAIKYVPDKLNKLTLGEKWQEIVLSKQGDLRKNPIANSVVIEKLNIGDEVEVIEKWKDWYKIKLSDGKIGWVHESLFDKKKPEK